MFTVMNVSQIATFSIVFIHFYRKLPSNVKVQRPTAQRDSYLIIGIALHAKTLLIQNSSEPPKFYITFADTGFTKSQPLTGYSRVFWKF